MTTAIDWLLRCRDTSPTDPPGRCVYYRWHRGMHLTGTGQHWHDGRAW